MFEEISIKILFDILLRTFINLVSVFGVVAILIILISVLSKSLRITARKAFGIRFFIIATGWIGVVIHELGHAVFCILFFHKINKIKLFQFKSDSTALGYVNHSFNQKNKIQIIGNIFIGLGPVFSAIISILIISYFLFPDLTQNLIKEILAANDFTGFFVLLRRYALSIAENNPVWKLVVFIYLTFAIGSHIELSMADIKGIIFGLICLITVIIIVTVISYFSGIDIAGFVLVFSKPVNLLSLFLLLAISVLIPFLFLIYLAGLIFNILKFKF